MKTNLQAFLDTIAYSELGDDILMRSDNGYNVLVGSTPRSINLFRSYKDHPRKSILIRPGLVSSAAGRYQILTRIYDHYKKTLLLPDFGKKSQDAIAIQLIKECHALEKIEEGHIADALHLCRSRWASLPEAGYGQHENSIEKLIEKFDIYKGSVR